MRSRCSSALVAAVVALLAAPAVPDTVYVDIDRPNDNGDGEGWATAYKHLQTGLANAVNGDEIWVAEGVYFADLGDSGESADGVFDLKEGVTVLGGFDATETSADDRDPENNETILDGDLDDDDVFETSDSPHVVRADGVTDATALDGFTIRGGYARSGTGGGGVFCTGAFPLVHRCTVMANKSDGGSGGGLLVDEAGEVDQDDFLFITECLIDGNEVTGISGGGGGGLAADAGSVSVNTDMAVIVLRTRIIDNSADTTGECGGGVFFRSPSAFGTDFEMYLVNCEITGNSANVAGGGITTKGLQVELPRLELVNCLVARNELTSRDGIGAGLENQAVDVVVHCSTFADNETDGDGGGFYQSGEGDADFTNCVFWDETHVTAEDQMYHEGTDTLTVTWSNVQGGSSDVAGGGTISWSNNLDIDPEFENPEDGTDSDYRLQDDSPCVNAGSVSDLPPDTFDLDSDANTTEDLPRDLDDADRVFDDFVDMGAYENACSCRTDLDDDGMTGFSDLLDLLVAWGTCSGCAEDFDADGNVDFDDLLELLANWGLCPCASGSPPESIEDEVESNSCLSEDDWDDYYDTMTDPTVSQSVKDNWHCWFDHYINDCEPGCGFAACSGNDPFGNPCGPH